MGNTHGQCKTTKKKMILIIHIGNVVYRAHRRKIHPVFHHLLCHRHRHTPSNSSTGPSLCPPLMLPTEPTRDYLRLPSPTINLNTKSPRDSVRLPPPRKSIQLTGFWKSADHL